MARIKLTYPNSITAAIAYLETVFEGLGKP